MTMTFICLSPCQSVTSLATTRGELRTRRKVEEMSPYVGSSHYMSPYLVHCRG